MGEVTIDGKIRELVEVTLCRIEQGNVVKMDSSKSLKNGKYTFHIWPRTAGSKYQIKAKSQYSAEGVSPVFAVTRGEESEVQPIDLRSLIIRTDAVHPGQVTG